MGRESSIGRPPCRRSQKAKRAAGARLLRTLEIPSLVTHSIGVCASLSEVRVRICLSVLPDWRRFPPFCLSRCHLTRAYPRFHRFLSGMHTTLPLSWRFLSLILKLLRQERRRARGIARVVIGALETSMTTSCGQYDVALAMTRLEWGSPCQTRHQPSSTLLINTQKASLVSQRDHHLLNQVT